MARLAVWLESTKLNTVQAPPPVAAWICATASAAVPSMARDAPACSADSLASPSIVVTSAPSASTASMVQLLTERPSTITTQAPH